MEVGAETGRDRRPPTAKRRLQGERERLREAGPGVGGRRRLLRLGGEEREIDHRGSKEGGCSVRQPGTQAPDRRGEHVNAGLSSCFRAGQAAASRALDELRSTGV